MTSNDPFEGRERLRRLDVMRDSLTDAEYASRRSAIIDEVTGPVLRERACECTSHVVNEATGESRKGAYVIRVAGTGLIGKCEYCDTLFRY